MIYRTCIPLLLVILVLILDGAICSAKNPQLMLRKSDVQDVRKAQIYLEKQLLMYDHRRADNYTLYLAVKNYADRL